MNNQINLGEKYLENYKVGHLRALKENALCLIPLNFVIGVLLCERIMGQYMV